MLTITARRGVSGICEISAGGHSGFAEAGVDIVCAAVSALMQALLVGLEDVLQVKVKLESEPETPFMKVEWDGSDSSTQPIAETILLSLKGVSAAYPEYVTVREIYKGE